MADDDAELVALIDNELDEASRSRLRARLSDDAALRARYDALRQGRADLTAAFDTLLERAPLDRLNAALPREEAPSTARRGLRGFALREFAAGLVVGLLAAGAAVWVALTFAGEGRLACGGRRLHGPLHQRHLRDTDPGPADAGRRIERGRQEDRSWSHAGYGGAARPDVSRSRSSLPMRARRSAKSPMSMRPESRSCSASSPTERRIRLVRTEIRDGFSLASWSRGGRGYLVIGRLPEQQAMQFAQLMETRL